MQSMTMRSSLRGSPCIATKKAVAARPARAAIAPRAEFIGSAVNQIMVVSTGLCLAAGRFGLAPTANRNASASLKLSENKSGLMSADPAGFTATDVLAMGAAGHVLGAGIVLGLKGIGAL